MFADVDLFADALIQNAANQPAVVLVSGPLLEDSTRWLTGDPIVSGTAPLDCKAKIMNPKDVTCVRQYCAAHPTSCAPE